LIGAITATVCFFAVSLKAKLKFDDSLDTLCLQVRLSNRVGQMA
jgi:ammonia channel protein AmtB